MAGVSKGRMADLQHRQRNLPTMEQAQAETAEIALKRKPAGQGQPPLMSMPINDMRKIVKRLREYFAPVDKVFLIGFTALTVATFDLSFHWLIATIAGYSFVAWQYWRR